VELKNLLKQLKMNESKISTVLGVLVIAVIGFMVFNYFRNIQPGTTTPTAVVTEDNQKEEAQKYTVKAGDSLTSIAREVYQNPNKWTLIRDANNIKDSNALEIGQELTIPADDVKLAEATAAPVVTSSPIATLRPTTKPTEAPKETNRPIATPAQPNQNTNDKNVSTATSYTVVRGDSLWSIAERVYGDGNQWTKISKANNLKNPGIIHAGNVFSIPR
jgi:nucleoid-associated protein YgaU